MRKEPRQQRSRALVQSLVEATEQVIVARGIELTTTNHIAAQAGVDIASLYQYFADKDDLVDALVRSLAEEIARAAKAHFASLDLMNVSPDELIRSVLTLGLALARAKPVLKEIDPKYFFGGAALGTLESELERIAIAYLRHRFRSFPVENLYLRLHIVSVSAFAVVARHFAEEAPLVKDDELVEELVRMFTPYFSVQGDAA